MTFFRTPLTNIIAILRRRTTMGYSLTDLRKHRDFILSLARMGVRLTPNKIDDIAVETLSFVSSNPVIEDLIITLANTPSKQDWPAVLVAVLAKHFHVDQPVS